MKPSSPIIWRFCLIILSLVLLAGVGRVWLSGEAETADAFASGRRLLIALDSGEVTGKVISSSETSEILTPPPAEEKKKCFVLKEIKLDIFKIHHLKKVKKISCLDNHNTYF